MGQKFINHPERARIESQLEQWARTHPEITRLIVYGSRARGDYRPDSDLDLAVELEAAGWDENPFTTWTASAESWRRELAPLLPWPLQLEWHDPNGETEVVAGGLLRDTSSSTSVPRLGEAMVSGALERICHSRRQSGRCCV